jgi:hypothetical protein
MSFWPVGVGGEAAVVAEEEEEGVGLVAGAVTIRVVGQAAITEVCRAVTEVVAAHDKPAPHRHSLIATG